MFPGYPQTDMRGREVPQTGGILGALSPQATAQTPSPMPTQGGGSSWLSNLFSDDPGAVPQRPFGMFGSTAPRTGAQKTALLFAGMRDALSAFRGKDSDYLNQQAQQDDFTDQRQRQVTATGALANALQGGIGNFDPVQYIRGGGNPDLALQLMQLKMKQRTPNQPFNEDGSPNPLYQQFQKELKETGPKDMNSPFLPNGQPNGAYQAWALKMKATGVPKAAQPNTDPFANPSGTFK